MKRIIVITGILLLLVVSFNFIFRPGKRSVQQHENSGPSVSTEALKTSVSLVAPSKQAVGVWARTTHSTMVSPANDGADLEELVDESSVVFVGQVIQITDSDVQLDLTEENIADGESPTVTLELTVERDVTFQATSPDGRAVSGIKVWPISDPFTDPAIFPSEGGVVSLQIPAGSYGVQFQY